MRPAKLDAKGRCCGRKPIKYQRPPQWLAVGEEFQPKYPDHEYALTRARQKEEPDGR